MSRSWHAKSPPNVGVLVAAAGAGERAGGGEPKQFRRIGGVPMLLRALRPFAQHPMVGELIVALPAEYAAAPPTWLREVAGERLRVVAGGATRAESVRAALRALTSVTAIVLVHDAARPFVSPETIEAVIATAARGVSAVPAVPISDTLKRVAEGSIRVVETVDRTGLWRAQTPQGFPRAVLEEVFGATPAISSDVTDEGTLVEAAGHAVELIPDRNTNLKITTLDDFALAEALARP